MKKNHETNEIARALARAQATMKPAEKTGFNSHRKYNYVELAGIMASARVPLSENGLAVTQFFEEGETEPILVTQLLHESGQSLESRLKLLPTPDYHALGSACTYTRKYSLAALLGCVAEGEDDDGEAAMAPVQQRASRPSAGAKVRKVAGKKAKPPEDRHIDALAIIDKVDGARAMLMANDIDPRDLMPQVIEKIILMGVDGMVDKVAKFQKEAEKKEAEAEAEILAEDAKKDKSKEAA